MGRAKNLHLSRGWIVDWVLWKARKMMDGIRPMADALITLAALPRRNLPSLIYEGVLLQSRLARDGLRRTYII